MGWLPGDRRDWLPELASALEAIATALAGQELTPERIAAAGPQFVDAVQGHQVEIDWFEHGYMHEPELDEPGEPEYAITIDGNRLNAGWLMRAADLPRVLSQSTSN